MIYVLEDDAAIRELVCYSLNKSGLEACGFALPSELLAAVRVRLPELFILDVMLPEEDGLSVLGKLRAAPASKRLPVIMLTARSTEFDKVTALDGGADDYITKPFGVMELISRVRAVLRRTQPEDEENKTFSAGGLSLAAASHTVTAGGREVTLTLKEFELLQLLFEHRGTVLTRDRILDEVWGMSFDGENRTVDVHVRTLRQKLGEYGSAVETVRGVGYRLRGVNA